MLRDGFTQGFRLGYKGDRSARESPNLKSVIQDPELALKNYKKGWMRIVQQAHWGKNQ